MTATGAGLAWVTLGSMDETCLGDVTIDLDFEPKPGYPRSLSP